eukprot:CAMPEP_0179025706 /NCGR_PEP_ID=MMETSP0796-20121207/8129_1 /TAXON_ID=73915 /ORGANISM="Pyrodinium bahamense, Strain pbaha01" /LENGTH=601 /DNA_ID=CAMNT_0020721747 /DNA_START=71 /DNA_END=1877 /DNA_ORIENTATION=+
MTGSSHCMMASFIGAYLVVTTWTRHRLFTSPGPWWPDAHRRRTMAPPSPCTLVEGLRCRYSTLWHGPRQVGFPAALSTEPLGANWAVRPEPMRSGRQSWKSAALTMVAAMVSRLQQFRCISMPSRLQQVQTRARTQTVMRGTMLSTGSDHVSQRRLSAEMLAYLVIYFVQGALGLARLAITFRLKDDLHLPPAEVAALMGIINLPWVLKPLYGFLSDAVPILGSHRRSYLVLAGLMGSGAWAYLASGAVAPASIIAGATVASLAVAVADVVADSIVVERTRAAEERGDRSVAGSLQSSCWLAQAVGGLASAYFSGSMLEAFGIQAVFAVTALLPLLVSISSAQLHEAPTGTVDSRPVGNEVVASSLEALEDARVPVLVRLRLLWAAVTDRRVLVPLAVLFLWLSKPSADVPFLYFLNNDLGWGPEMLGRLRLAESAASFLGILFYRVCLKEVSTRKIFVGTTIAYLPFGLVQILLVTKVHRRWGIPDAAIAFGDDVGLAALAQVAFMPTLVLAARLCPPGVEGALFATLMSIYNLARIVGQEAGGLLTKLVGVTETDFANLPLLLGICTLASLVPLPLLGVFDSIDGDFKGKLGQRKKLAT